jgi:hypothetical protein
MTMSGRRSSIGEQARGRRVLVGLAVAGAVALVPTAAFAQDPVPVAPPPAPKNIGGHIGVATPVVTISDTTTTIGDNVTVVDPIGVTVKLTPLVAVDFEVVVSTPLRPKGGTTALIVDPGVIFDLGLLAAGLRVAWQIGEKGNIGLIPLVNKGLVKMGPSTWFVEAAFPTFYMDSKVAFNVVLHTGVGF